MTLAFDPQPSRTSAALELAALLMAHHRTPTSPTAAPAATEPRRPRPGRDPLVARLLVDLDAERAEADMRLGSRRRDIAELELQLPVLRRFARAVGAPAVFDAISYHPFAAQSPQAIADTLERTDRPLRPRTIQRHLAALVEIRVVRRCGMAAYRLHLPPRDEGRPAT